MLSSVRLRAQRMQAQLVSAHNQLEKLVDDNSANWKQVSKQIWDFAELGYHEEKAHLSCSRN